MNKSSNTNHQTYRKVADIIPNVYQDLEAQHINPDTLAGISTGFDHFDTITGGIKRGNLILIASRSSMGKSTFAMNIVQNMAIRHHSTTQDNQSRQVMIFSLEMSSKHVVSRMIASEARIDLYSLDHNLGNHAEWGRMNDAVTTLAKTNIFIDDTENLTPNALREQCLKFNRESGNKRLDMVVVDYLQLMSSSVKQESRMQDLQIIIQTLKNIAQELDAPIILLSQLNRSLEIRDDKRPVMSDLREIKAIERYANLVCFLYRDEIYNPTSDNSGMAELIIAKNDTGPVGTIKFNFSKSCLRFD